MPQLTSRMLSRFSYLVGAAGIADTFGAAAWVVQWSPNAHAAIRGTVVCMVGVAAVVVAALLTGQRVHAQTVMRVNQAVGVLLEAEEEAAKVAELAPPHLRLCESPPRSARR